MLRRTLSFSQCIKNETLKRRYNRRLSQRKLQINGYEMNAKNDENSNTQLDNFSLNEDFLESMNLISPEKTAPCHTLVLNNFAFTRQRRHNTKYSSKKRLNFDDGSEKRNKFKRRFLNGYTKLDIMSLLDPLPDLKDKILFMLAPRDLCAMTLVSQRWRRIVNTNKTSVEILQKLQREHALQKENSLAGNANDKPTTRRCSLTPLNSTNKDTHLEFTELEGCNEDSFTENQKVVETLNRHERLVKCPRCGRGSRIECAFTSIDANNKRRNSFKMSDDKTPSAIPNSDYKLFERPAVFSMQGQNLNSDFISNADDCKSYGKCTGNSCSYKFCLNCYCSPHPGSKCRISELGTPSKVHQDDHSVRQSRSKVKRRSLKRLCF